ncbi:suppressor APC domain-containing protein 2-like isoform X2 [Myxocyprinus asiaticus]|uniref:suppressor APC domain-containing protein 2-like isoform X2 n=1 Tax=Myxocyprinus asiaticus TaxID=70543 RepID=UPI002221E73B|nr:suppressor APC domain-containing protein 2-like isoform X2 [Myxocyprinus asiaticus]
MNRDATPSQTEWIMECSASLSLSPLPLMVVNRVGPRGLDAGESLWATYTTVFIPLSSSLFSSRALSFYVWLKQMKELEQEKDSLLAGLDVLEQAREWYQTRIHNVTETQRQVGQSHQSTEFFAESCQSRMDLLLPKLQEVTRCLNDLISFSETALPSGSSLSASSSYSAPPAPPQAILILKEQNRLLTQEVTEKSERITQLEQEKSALIKQLFEARARNTHDSSALDSTFI